MGQVASGCCDRREEDFNNGHAGRTDAAAFSSGDSRARQEQKAARQLPRDWEEVCSKTTGKAYYYNRCPTWRPAPAARSPLHGCALAWPSVGFFRFVAQWLRLCFSSCFSLLERVGATG